MPWSLPGVQSAISKGAALVRLPKSARKACADIALHGSVCGTSEAAGGEDKSSPTAVFPVDLQALLRDARSENVEHHLCTTCRPIFLHIIGAYEDHPLYDSTQADRVRREVDRQDWGWCGTKREQALYSNQGYSSERRSFQEACEAAFKGCDACRLVLFLIATADTDGCYKDGCVIPEDQLKVHLRRWEANESRVLEITHYGRAGPAFAGEVFLSMATERENPASKYVSGRVDFNGTESLRLLELANEWLQECSTSPSHKNCLSEDKILPSRVLDVRNGLQLRETKDLFGRYATLSYCWGGDQPSKLLATNRSDYMKGICEVDQPKTIRDAVKVTRAIGLDFLWVDSYCIIQDSAEDKDKEIQHMAQIFQNSFVTIVAAGAPSVHHGFLKPSSNLELIPFQVSLPDSNTGTSVPSWIHVIDAKNKRYEVI